MTARLLAATLPFLVMHAVPVRAQTIDYGAAEQMLGEPVTTSVTGKPQRASDVPANLEIITADQIRRSGAITIPEVLRFVTGLDVRRYGQLDFAVGIRGYNTALNPRVLVLLDGRQVYSDDYGMTVWPLIPVALSEIRQIEIIKGPSAALYGFNAVSGVINIVTYDPLRDKINTAAAFGGTQNQAYGEAVATGQVPDTLGIRLSAKGFRANDFRGLPGTVTDQPRSGTVALDMRARLAPGIEWTLSGSAGSLTSAYYPDVGQYRTLSDDNASIRSRITADTDMGLLQLDAYHNRNNLQTSAIRPLTWQQDITVVQASNIFKWGSDHTFRVGAEYRNNAITSNRLFAGTLGYQIGAGSAMWEWQILPELALTNAVRVDALWLSHDGPQFVIPGMGPLYRDTSLIEPSFNSGVVYRASEADTFRLTAARAIQIPSLVSFGLSATVGPLIIAGNPGLLPSAVTSVEIDYDRALPELASVLRAALFLQDTNVTLGSPFGSGASFLPTGQPAFLAKNFRGSEQIGAEIGIRGAAEGFRWNASYALADVRDRTPAVLLRTAPSVSYESQTPVHAVIVGGGWTWDRFDVDAQVRWQSRYQDYRLGGSGLAVQPVPIPNFVTANVRFAYRLTDTAVASLTAEQLNQQFQLQTAGVSTERRVFGGIQVHF